MLNISDTTVESYIIVHDINQNQWIIFLGTYQRSTNQSGSRYIDHYFMAFFCTIFIWGFIPN